MKRFVVLILATCSLFVSANAQELIAIRDSVADGYSFWLHKPIEKDSIPTPKPLVICLHGASLCGKNLYLAKQYGTVNALEMGRELDAYVVAPLNPGGSWNPQKILNVMEWTTERCPIDTNRVYVIGMSLGGYGTIDFVGTYPEKIAAAMALCGGGTLKSYEGLSKVPLWIIHGTADRAVPVSQSQKVADKIKAHNDSLLIFDKWEGANHSILARLYYLPETYEWLFSHSLADSTRTVNREVKINRQSVNLAYKGFDKSFKLALTDETKHLDKGPGVKKKKPKKKKNVRR